MTEDKKKILEATLKQINKDFGDGSIMALNEKPSVKIDAISSGSFNLDLALGIGGLPRGRIIEIYGPESSGKTTIATTIVAEAQKKGSVCAYIDVEHSFDKEYAQNLGVNINELQFSQPTYGEQALNIVDMLATSGAVDVIVVDSVAALVPKSELEGEVGDNKIGLQARLMSQAMRKLCGIVQQNNVLLIFINQLREKIGIMFGNPEVTAAGHALKYYSSVRLDIRKKATNMANDVAESNTVKVKVVKNKVAPPFRIAEFDIVFGKGIDRTKEILDLAITFDIIKKAGSWFSYKDTKLGQGSALVKDMLENNPDFKKEVEEQVLAKINETN